MTHLSDLQLSMYCDNALSETQALAVQQHLDSCEVCQQQKAAIALERTVLTTALLAEPDAQVPLVIPKFSRPTSLRDFAIANLVTGLVIWLVQFLWKTLFGELIMNAASRISSIYLPDTYEVVNAATLHFLQQGTAMLNAYLGFVIFGVVTLTVVSLLLLFRRSHATVASLCVLAFTGAALLAPAPAAALDFRRDDGVISVAATETIDDTLIVAAETILIKGTVTGDLIATGRRIDIDGAVQGNLVAFAESVTVRGSVGGMVLSAGSFVELEGASVAGNLWAAGDSVAIDAQAQVAGNAAMGGDNVTVEGPVGKDLYAFAEVVELNSAVGQNLEAFAEQVRLLDDTQISGSARLRLESKSDLDRAAGAQVDGEVEFLALPEAFEETNRYSTGEFYLWQLARLISAVVAGLVLFWLVPGLRRLSLNGGFEGLKAAGIGLAALVSVPVAAALAAVTLVGIPLSVVALFAWIILIYLAKVVIGAFIGQLLLGSTKYQDNLFLILLTGIATVLVLVNLPAIGGIVSFLLTLIGIGLLVQRLLTGLQARQAPAA